VSGPSGAGKTSVCRALKRDPRVEFSVSATTRAKRSGERDGVDYWFLTPEEFERRVADGEFLEHAHYSGNRYGTLRDPLERARTAGKVYILEIEVQGTRQLRDADLDAAYVFIAPPSLDEIRRRLVARGTDNDAEIDRRLGIAARELEAQSMYDYVVVNDDLDRAIAQVKELIGL
jgi:guanylate kinase